METYQYSPLLNPSVDIRLLTLFPGTFDADICFSLSNENLRRPPESFTRRLPLDELRKTVPSGWEVDETLDGRYLFERGDFTTWTHPDPNVPPASYRLPLDGKYPGFEPQYEALSYTWGLSQDTEVAFVQSCSDNNLRSTLDISKNLAAALRHLRHGYKPRKLWVDAVCVNQNDTLERNSQVVLMADIYRLAHRVVVWLGPESDNSGLALRTLEHIGSQVAASRWTTLYASPEATHKDWFRSRTTIPLDNKTCKAVLSLVNRPWFDRVWIIQEIQLANARATIQCGFDSIPWMQLRVALICLSNKVHLSSRELFDRARHKQDLSRNLGSLPVIGLFAMSRYSNCSDPRDKIYGILGLASESLVARIRPQYSLPTAEVYRDTFLAILEDVQSLNLLLSCSLAERQLPALPSWVPDWSVPKTSNSANTSFASSVSRPQTVFRPPNVLEVSGIHIATVHEVKGPAPRSEAEVLSSIRLWAPPNLTTGSYPTGESLEDAFAATIIMGLVKERYPRWGPAPTIAEWKATMTAILSNDRVADTTLLGYMTGCAFIITDDGHFGLGPDAAKPGDYICVILGTADLVVLRPSNQAMYEVVGPCSLRGFSDAEALLGPLPWPWMAVFRRPNAGGSIYFRNHESGERTHADPRLGPLPYPWQEVRPQGKEDDFTVASQFRNKTTGEVMESDPRMLPEALEARGVLLERFCLV